MTKLTKFKAAVGLQIAIILAMIIFKLSVLSSGTEVLLKIAPVDPTSPLRGDYLTFQYNNISQLEPGYFQRLGVKNGTSIYVVLYKSGKYWQAKSVSLSIPTANQVFIKGRVAGEPSKIGGGGRYRIVYGIEEYFIPEGKGRDFRFGNQETAAGVAVDDNGNAVLKHIYVNGRLWP